MTHGYESKGPPITVRLTLEALSALEFIQKHAPRPRWSSMERMTRTAAVEEAVKFYAAAVRREQAGKADGEGPERGDAAKRGRQVGSRRGADRDSITR